MWFLPCLIMQEPNHCTEKYAILLTYYLKLDKIQDSRLIPFYLCQNHTGPAVGSIESWYGATLNKATPSIIIFNIPLKVCS